MKNKQGGGERDLLERVMHNRFFRGTALFVRRYFDHRVARDSAALTYYLLFAMFPLLIFLSNLVGFFAVDIEGFLRQLGTIIPAEVLDLLIQYLRYVSRVSSRTLMTFSLIFSIWFPMRAANALLLSVRKAYGMGRPTQFLRHQAKVFLYTICLILTILLSLVLVTVGRSVLNLCADYFHFSAILTDGFIELWSTLRFVFLGCIVFLALAVLYGLAQETRSVHYVWPGVPPGGKFIGAKMPLWMRIHGGIGLHVGTVYRDANSHGCIRVPVEACRILFDKCGLGTAVIVQE